MSDDLQFLPANGARPEQLMILLHGYGADAADLLPLARALQREFPQAALLLPEGFEPCDAGGPGRQWFPLAGIDDGNRAARLAAVLPKFIDWVHAQQQRLLPLPEATALVGFSQGAIMALEAVQAEDGLAGRVLAFAGRYATLPAAAPQRSTLHLLHGSADTVMPVAHARAAMDRLALLGGDATLDVAEGVGHELHPALVDQAIHRLRSHIPYRTWQAALGAVPPMTGRGGSRNDDDTSAPH